MSSSPMPHRWSSWEFGVAWSQIELSEGGQSILLSALGAQKDNVSLDYQVFHISIHNKWCFSMTISRFAFAGTPVNPKAWRLRLKLQMETCESMGFCRCLSSRRVLWIRQLGGCDAEIGKNLRCPSDWLKLGNFCHTVELIMTSQGWQHAVTGLFVGVSWKM